jgi:hypothetical protein
MLLFVSSLVRYEMLMNCSGHRVPCRFALFWQLPFGGFAPLRENIFRKINKDFHAKPQRASPSPGGRGWNSTKSFRKRSIFFRMRL